MDSRCNPELNIHTYSLFLSGSPSFVELPFQLNQSCNTNSPSSFEETYIELPLPFNLTVSTGALSGKFTASSNPFSFPSVNSSDLYSVIISSYFIVCFLRIKKAAFTD